MFPIITEFDIVNPDPTFTICFGGRSLHTGLLYAANLPDGKS